MLILLSVPPSREHGWTLGELLDGLQDAVEILRELCATTFYFKLPGVGRPPVLRYKCCSGPLALSWDGHLEPYIRLNNIPTQFTMKLLIALALTSLSLVAAQDRKGPSGKRHHPELLENIPDW